MNQTLSSDPELLRAYARDGNQEAFARLVDRHWAYVCRVCHRVLGNAADADDAAQAAFLVLARKAPALLHRQDLLGWLHHVARYAALNACRARARRQQAEAAAAGERDADPATTEPGEALAVADLVETLPAKYRTVLLLHHGQGLTHEQIAQQLGIAPGTVAWRLHHGRRRLGRLARRGGVVAAGAALTGALASSAWAAVPPAGLAPRLDSAAMAWRQGAPAPALPESVTNIAQGVLHMLHRQLWSTAASLVATVALLATGLWLVHAGGTAAPPAAAAGQPAAPAVKPASAPVATAPAPAAPATAAPAAAPAKLTGEVSYTSTIEVQTAKLTLKAETEVFIKRPDFLLLRVRTDQHECEIVRQGQQVHVRHAREEAFAAGPDWPATRARILEHVPAALRPAVIAALVTIDTATKGATFDQNFYANYAGVAFRALFEMGGLGPESEAKSYDLAIHGRDSILAAGSGVTPDGDGLFIKEFQISWDAAVKGAQPPAVPATPGGGAAATARQPAASWQEALHNVRVSRELVPFLAVLEASYAAPKDLAKELQTLKVTGIAWDKTPVADAIADLGDKIAAAHPDGARIPILLLTEFAEAKRNLPPVTATFRQATVAEVLTVLCRDAQLRLEVGEDKILLF